MSTSTETNWGAPKVKKVTTTEYFEWVKDKWVPRSKTVETEESSAPPYSPFKYPDYARPYFDQYVRYMAPVLDPARFRVTSDVSL